MQLIANPVLVTAPTEDAVSLTSVKDFLRIDGTADDTALTTLTRACTKRVEALLDRKLITQTWDIFFDGFPCARKDVWWDGVRDGSQVELNGAPLTKIDLPFGPLVSITYVHTFGEDNVAVVFDSASYQADVHSPQGRVLLKTGYVWPSTVLRPSSGVLVRGIFGFGAQAAIPDDIKQGLLSFIAKAYEHRGDEIPTMPSSAQLLFEPYRRIRVG